MKSASTGLLDLCMRFSRAHTAMLRRFDVQGNLHGISFSDFQLLHQLARAPGNRLRRVDLAEQLGLTASGVTRSLLPLEKIGLVTRQADARDARVGYAVLTASGKQLLNDATVTAEQIAQDILGQISNSRIDALSALLAQLINPQFSK